MIEAPLAAVIEHVITQHGHKREDPFYWLKDRDNPAVIEYLERENDYFETMMKPLSGVRKQLYQEMRARIQEDDSTPPFKEKNYYYYKRYETNWEYPLYCRKYQDLDHPEQVYLDVNILAKGHEFLNIGNIDVSEGEQRLAYSYDTQGRNIYTIVIEDLISKKVYETLLSTTGDFVWSGDDNFLFYTKQDPETLRPYQVWRHKVGEPQSQDALVYEEADETYHLSLGKSQSREYLFIYAGQTVTTEYQILPANRPEDNFQPFLIRQRGHEYHIDHLNGQFYILTNADAPNFQLMVTREGEYAPTEWQPFIRHDPEKLLEDFVLYDNAMIVQQRVNGLTQFAVMDYQIPHQLDYLIDMPDPSYAAWQEVNLDPHTPVFRYQYNSMARPTETIAFNWMTREKTILKTQKVLGNFSADHYRVERLWAKAKDGKSIPISLVYHKDFPPASDRPLLLYGYGAYGISLQPRFSSDRLSLLNRGVTFAIAHIRGGEDLGRQWYAEGRQLHKQNTFDDFIASAQYLIHKGYTSSPKLVAMGGSAGGLLMGAVMNQQPTLFHAIVAQVPFVDVLTTMLDPDIPLTTGEFDEWGNPADKTYYDYILKYSPYDNVQKTAYPHLLVTTGLHDSQVQFWEPAKWVAKLRRHKTNDTLTLLKTNMKAGHQGMSGRFEYLKETADEFAFILGVLDLVPEDELS